MLRRGFRNSVPPRAPGLPHTMISVTDLPSILADRQPSDICIGLPSSQGHMLRVLLRQRLTLLAGIDQAGQLAEQLAQEQDETVLSHERLPSAVHLLTSEEGSQVWLDYDLGPRTHPHPRVVRRLTLLLWARPDHSLSQVAVSRSDAPRSSAATDEVTEE